MKRWLGILLAVCIWLCGVPATRAAAADAPSVSASACVLLEAGACQVLYEQNGREKLPMASTTKIMTTLLTLESGGLDEAFVVDSDAIRVEGSSMGLVEGDIVTKRALCCGMLLPSGNDAANAAAVAVAGSIPAFAELMNERAAQIGMTRSCFVTPSGLDAKGHGASAYDMALLAREALQNSDFREICAQPQARVSFGNPPYERTLYNSNKLLGMYEGVIGVKTGFTDAAGRCLVSACERDGVTLICVTLHAPDDWQDHMRLYDYGFSRVQAAEPELPALTQRVAGGQEQEIALLPEHPVTIGAVDGTLPELTARVLLPPFAYAPVAQGDAMGVLEYEYEGRVIASVPLLAAQSVPAEPEPAQGRFARLLTWLRQVLRL